MKIVFWGDRSSKTIRLGWFLRKYFKNTIVIMVWDGYKSRIFLKGGEKK
ncbi:hypothetical protein KAU51_04205 [Candidatus Parcubacteria bacterium]|nr:hypothetical protein [Candidatus Parcubacteria bacterium]